MAWVGQRDGEGGIVDMFIDDTIGQDKRDAKKKKMTKKKVTIKKRPDYCYNCGTKVKKMGPS